MAIVCLPVVRVKREKHVEGEGVIFLIPKFNLVGIAKKKL